MKKIEKFTMFHYYCLAIPNKVDELLSDYAFGKPKGNNDRLQMLVAFVKKYKDEALTELASIHPDKSLIIENEGKGESNNYVGEMKEKPHTIEPKYLKAEGEEPKPASSTNGKIMFSENMAKALIIGGVALISVVLITSAIKKR